MFTAAATEDDGHPDPLGVMASTLGSPAGADGRAARDAPGGRTERSRCDAAAAPPATRPYSGECGRSIRYRIICVGGRCR